MNAVAAIPPVETYHPPLPRIGGRLVVNALEEAGTALGEAAGEAASIAGAVFVLLFPTEAGRDGMLSPAQVHSHLLTGAQIAQRTTVPTPTVPTRVRLDVTEDANGNTKINAWGVQGKHENMPVVNPVTEGDRRIYHLPDGPVLTWYPGQAPQLPKNTGYPGELLDLGNTLVHPMPTTEAEIKAQGFPQQVSD